MINSLREETKFEVKNESPIRRKFYTIGNGNVNGNVIHSEKKLKNNDNLLRKYHARTQLKYTAYI